MACMNRGKFAAFAIILQTIFIVLFAVFAKYDESAQPTRPHAESPIPTFYPMFQDIHVMVFVGFGFLMTFLKRYGYSSISINLLISAFVIQWATILRGLIHGHVGDGEKFPISLNEMIMADFAAATVLISFGAVLGKTSPLQLLVMALIEVVISEFNGYIGIDILQVSDIGGSMFIHAFGAYFGLACAWVLYSKDVKDSEEKEGSVYHSDLFSMIGTIFLWMYWPSFNGGPATGDERHRAILHTYFSLAACTIFTFAVSSAVDKEGKMDMVHIQNATLAGGVAIGTAADMPIGPWAPLVVGSVAGVLSTLGYKYLTPILTRKLKLHDTCGVNNLHGMPGILAGITGAIAVALATTDSWGESMYELLPATIPAANTTEWFDLQKNVSFPLNIGEGRSIGKQAAFQMAALCITLGIAIIGGALTGLLLRLPIWDKPTDDDVFDDRKFWGVPTEGFPSISDVDSSKRELYGAAESHKL